jgi:signal transduction histidine kinase
MVDNIRRSSDILLTLVNDILDFSKFDSGNIKVTFT